MTIQKSLVRAAANESGYCPPAVYWGTIMVPKLGIYVETSNPSYTLWCPDQQQPTNQPSHLEAIGAKHPDHPRLELSPELFGSTEVSRPVASGPVTLSASIKRPKSEHHGPKVVRRERGDSFELGKRHLDRHLAGERELARHAPDGDGGADAGTRTPRPTPGVDIGRERVRRFLDTRTLTESPSRQLRAHCSWEGPEARPV
jgi:hypothetical protein